MTDSSVPNLMTPEEQADALGLLQDIVESDGDVRGMQAEIAVFLQPWFFTRAWSREET